MSVVRIQGHAKEVLYITHCEENYLKAIFEMQYYTKDNEMNISEIYKSMPPKMIEIEILVRVKGDFK